MGFTERLLRFSLRNTLTLVLLSLLWMGLATWCYFTLPISLLPNLNFPTLSVVVENPGLTAEALERQVALPIESAMAGIYNVSRIRSASVANLSLITIQLHWGADLDIARQQVLQKIATVQGNLPVGSTVQLESLSNSIGQVQGFVFSGGKSLTELHDWVEYRLKPLLLQQDGVFQVLIFGGLAPEYAAFIQPARLQKYDLTLRDIKDALNRNNVASAGGILDLGSQSFAIVAKTQLVDLNSIQNTVVAVKNGVTIRIKDLGRVTLSHLPYRGGAEREGQSGVVVQIVKQPEADTMAVTQRVLAFMNQYQPSFPQGVTVSKYYDQSELVGDSIRGVEEAVLLGAALVGFILLFFLRSWRASLVAFTSIPTALLSALVFMKLLGLSINIMTLSALAIATGMVIDDAIVVIENFFRHRALHPNDSVAQTFVNAAAEVAGPVASSTITTVAIFVPLIFLSGLAGRLFSPVGVVVSIVMIASLVFAFTLIPSVGPHLMGTVSHPPQSSRLTDHYLKMLERAMRYRALTISIVLLICILSFFLLTRLNREFLPLLDEGSVLMTVDTPPGSSLNETLRVTRLLVKEVLVDSDVETRVSVIGHAPGAQDVDTMNHADVMAKLVPAGKRKKTINELFTLFRKRAEDFPGVLIDFTMPLQDKLNDAIGGVSATIGIKIYGDDFLELQKITNKLTDGMSKLAGVVDLRPGSIVPVPAVEVNLIPEKANAFGVTREDLNDAVQAMSFGIQAAQVTEVYRQIPFRIRFEGTDDEVPTLHLDEMRRIPLRTADGPFVPLSQIATVGFSQVPGRIDHEHASRLVTVSCNVSGASNQDVINGIQKIFSDIQLPHGYSYEVAGSYAAQGEAMQGVTGMALAALILVASILWIEFESLRKMVLVLFTIPLSTIGASLSLWATGQSLNVSSLIGLVLLIGIVLRNGIVLVDYIHLAIQRGMPLHQAIEEGAKVRLRPILMTALSEILGLSPLALGIGSGSALERPLAIAVIGGLTTSTFLTLFILPLGYRILYRELNEVPERAVQGT